MITLTVPRRGSLERKVKSSLRYLPGGSIIPSTLSVLLCIQGKSSCAFLLRVVTELFVSYPREIRVGAGQNQSGATATSSQTTGRS